MIETHVEVTIDHAAVARVSEMYGRQALERAGRKTVERARANLQGHNVSNRLRESLQWEIGGGGRRIEMVVGSDLDYALFVEKGRGPVKPVRAKVLRFKPRGSSTFVFAREVGPAKPVRFLERALRDLSARDFGE